MSPLHHGDKVRPPRTHYRPTPHDKPLCGTTGARPTCTGEEDFVTCHSCLRAIAARKREGRVDLFGSAK